MEFKIRAASKDDGSEITKLTSELGYLSSEEKIKEILDMVLIHDDHRLLVAETENKLVAYIHLICTMRIGSDPFVEVAAFVIHSDYRKKGIGRNLLKESEKWTDEKNYKYLRIRSNIIREEAYKFFTQQGFTNLKTQEVFLKQVRE